MSTPVVCAITLRRCRPPMVNAQADHAPSVWRGLGLAWHAVEATVAARCRAAGSVALIGFGIDSVIEAAAGFIVLWRFREGAATSQTVERRAQQAIAVSFFVLAGYVAVESVRALLNADRPETSLIGIALAAGDTGDHAAPRARQGARRNRTPFECDGRRRAPKHPVRLSVRRTARGTAGERLGRRVVARQRRGPGDRRLGGPGRKELKPGGGRSASRAGVDGLTKSGPMSTTSFCRD